MSLYYSEKSPFFIVGCERSGTTLLQTLLDAHPNIAIPPESHIFHRFAQVFDSYKDLQRTDNLERFVTLLLEDHWIQRWDLNISVQDFCAGLKTRTITGCIDHLFHCYLQKVNKCRWAEKTPLHVMYLPRILEFFPQAKFIHLIRDGRDMAESMRRMWFGPTSIYGIAQRWRTRVGAFYDFKSQMHPNQYLELRYEDLVSEPDKYLAILCEFLEEPPIQIGDHVPDTHLKDFYANHNKAGTYHKSLLNQISTKKIGIYRTVLTAREIEIFEYVAQSLLRVYGYSMETSVPIGPHLGEKSYFWFQDMSTRYTRKLREPFFLKAEWQLRQRNHHRNNEASMANV